MFLGFMNLLELCAKFGMNAHVHYFSFFPFFFLLLFRATFMAYGGSQARGPIGAIAAGLHHSHNNMGSEPPSVTYTTAHGNARSLTH